MTANQPIKLLHFADAHIDIANYGRHDAETGLPIRVMDFLRSLDQIVETAVAEQVDLVVFAGDAYKDRNPHPTFQREWGRRMMQLSEAGIPTLLLVGNHDISPASGRAHTLHEFSTLNVPYIYVADTVKLWTPDELGLPVQIITIPWIARSRFVNREEVAGMSIDEVYAYMEDLLQKMVSKLIATAEPDIPLILTAHASVSGAKYGSERAVMLGHEIVLSGGMVNNKKLDYVALGHIHKHQILSGKDMHPPIIYPGSIERIDFGEAKEKKGFILAEITKGQTEWEFVDLKTRRFIDLGPLTPSADSFMADIMEHLPEQARIAGAVCRLKLSYGRDLEPLLDESALRDYFKDAFDLNIQKHHFVEGRARLGDAISVESLTPEELLDMYWDTIGLEIEEIEAMQALAKDVLSEID